MPNLGNCEGDGGGRAEPDTVASVSEGTRFRENAVTHATSPEQLDRMIRIVPPRRAFALGAILLVLVATVVWAIVATIPTTLTGPGFLLPQGGLRVVEAASTGTVTSLRIADGDHVVADEPIGEITDALGLVVPIRAPETGEITEVDTVLHDHVTIGDRLALVQPVGWPLVVYAYLPTSDAGTLAVGTEVEVEFGAGIGSEYGFARGHVVDVSGFAATAERLAFILQDSSLVDTVRALGPANEITIALELSATTESGLVWGVGAGPPLTLPAGLPADVRFIVGSRHPISDLL